MSISNRIDKLEQVLRERVTNVVPHPVWVRSMSDEQLMEAILVGSGIDASSSNIAEHLGHFNATGELPGEPTFPPTAA